MPKFIIDEDMPRSTGKVLKNFGYEIKDIRDFGLRGADDEDNHQLSPSPAQSFTSAGPPNPLLQRTRLRRGSTGRSPSQAFGLATVRVYHRRAAELNRSAAFFRNCL